MSRPKVIISEFKHETNSFCVNSKTGENEFKEWYLLKNPTEIIPFFEDTKTEIGGFIAASKREQFEIIPVIAAQACPGGLVRREIYELVKDNIKKAIKKTDNLDGILLSLHGAMVLENAQDGEGELLNDIRREIGSEIPIVATLDLHANVTYKMVKNADAFFTYEQYPHIDYFERGYEAGKCLAGLIRKEIKPVMKLKKIPILSPPMETAKEPYKSLYDRIHQWEENPEVIKVSLQHGFALADIPDAGMSVLAVTNNDGKLAEDIVDEMAKTIWEKRSKFQKNFISPESAVKKAMEYSSGPVIIADFADNPGGGGTCDSTFILRELVKANAKNVGLAIITDPETVGQAIDAGVGSKINVNLGGKLGPKEVTGGPLKTTAQVKTITDGEFINKGPMSQGVKNNIGRTVVLDIGDIEIIVTEFRFQPWDAEIFRRMGIEPYEKKILVLKSCNHYKASFGPMAKKILEVDTPEYNSHDFKRLKFKNLKHPVFPL